MLCEVALDGGARAGPPPVSRARRGRARAAAARRRRARSRRWRADSSSPDARAGARADPAAATPTCGRRSGARCSWRSSSTAIALADRPPDRACWLGEARTRGRRAGLVVANAGLGLPPVVLGVYPRRCVPARRRRSGGCSWLNTLHGDGHRPDAARAADRRRAHRGRGRGPAGRAARPGARVRRVARRGAACSRCARRASACSRAVIAALLSALAEVGAVIIVGGNIRGTTNTLGVDRPARPLAPATPPAPPPTCSSCSRSCWSSARCSPSSSSGGAVSVDRRTFLLGAAAAVLRRLRRRQERPAAGTQTQALARAQHRDRLRVLLRADRGRPAARERAGAGARGGRDVQRRPGRHGGAGRAT